MQTSTAFLFSAAVFLTPRMSLAFSSSCLDTKDNPISSDGYNEEITGLLRELKLELPPLTPVDSGRDIRDVVRHLSMTEEKLHGQILMEIEQNKSPNPKAGDGSTPWREISGIALMALSRARPTRTVDRAYCLGIRISAQAPAEAWRGTASGWIQNRILERKRGLDSVLLFLWYDSIDGRCCAI
jgi:hypothetical protein